MQTNPSGRVHASVADSCAVRVPGSAAAAAAEAQGAHEGLGGGRARHRVCSGCSST
jgi:hypothetical protein